MPEAPTIAAPAPGFQLPLHGGGTWSLGDHVGGDHRRPIVIVFHRHIH
ncbi:hypothetical protein [Ilumatobacter nonamiensis]|nr:hypothetical protein [Ilumatobacter nonamiensis]